MGTMSDVKEERRCLLHAPQPSPSPGPRSCCLSGDKALNQHPTQLPSALWCPGALRKGWTGRRSTPTYAGKPPPEAWQRSLGCLRGSQTLQKTPRPWSCPGTCRTIIPAMPRGTSAPGMPRGRGPTSGAGRKLSARSEHGGS